MKQLYINGKQATLWQKVLLTLGTIGFLILIIPLGIGILAIGAVAAAVFYVYLYFKLKKLKKVLNAQNETVYQQQRSENFQKNTGNTIDGEYKEL